jgi:hypothetical protein
MDEQKKLHYDRLRASLKTNEEFQARRLDANNPDFSSWVDRTKNSLMTLFGEEHNYTLQFANLRFRKMRLHRHGEPREWSEEDQEKFEGDLKCAQQILTDAIEEYECVLAKSGPMPDPIQPTGIFPTPPIVINIHNILSQTTQVQLQQLIANLDNMGLSQEELAQAQLNAEELDKEMRGSQRWPVLAKHLDALKSMGKAVYQNIAVPLLLEYLKREMGLS